jgi:hypothetical protein
MAALSAAEANLWDVGPNICVRRAGLRYAGGACGYFETLKLAGPDALFRNADIAQ